MNNKSLRELADEFILYKRALGYVYETPAHYIKRYVDYVDSIDSSAEGMVKRYTDQFLASIMEKPGSLYGTVAVLREFGRYLQNHGYNDAYIIAPKTCKQPVPEQPYFFTSDEIEAFFVALDSIEKHPSFKGRELVFPTLFRLLYCCGLRCKEVRTLQCKDVHLDELYIDILQSKGPKSRRLFISKELADYLKRYNSEISVLFPEREYFFPNNNGYYKTSAVSNNFKRFWKKAYPDFEMGSRPRAYDLRHHFAWANLNRWAAEGMDINVMVAYLSKYMGHQCISETLYYFHFVPDFFLTYKDMTKEFEDIIPEVAYEE